MRLKKNGIDWELADDFAPLLDAVLADEGATVKHTPTKLVSLHRFDAGTYYVKRYCNFAVALRPLKFWFKKSEARNEWELAQRYQALGIPVVRHLAVGNRWTALGLQESILITEGFEGVPLSKFPDHQSDAVQAALGQLLRQMHEHGVLQPDLQHNILVRREPLELRRIDVDRGVIRPTLSREERLRNLAYLHIFVPLTETFFRTYGLSADGVAAIKRSAVEMKRPLCARRSRWCVRCNLRFEPKRVGQLTWHVRREFWSDKLRGLLEDPDGNLERCTKLFKSGPNRTSTVGAFDGFVLKRYNIKKKISVLKDLFRESRAIRAYRKAYHLELLGIPTPRPVAAAERRRLRVLLHSYFVMEEILGAIELGEYLRRVQRPHRQVISKIGELIGRLHDEGFSHRDLKETNVILDGKRTPYVIDLEGLTYQKRVPMGRAVADLQRLARGVAKYPSVTPQDRAAFLRAYCRTRGIRASHLVDPR